MTDNSDDELERIDREDIPENAEILQCGTIIGDGGMIGRIEEREE